MAKVFKVRQMSLRLLALTLLSIALFAWFGIKQDEYTVFIAVIVPVALWTDQLMSKILVQENGDVWVKRGFTGMVRLYGISKLVYRKKARAGQQIKLYHTKGVTVVDPADKKAFVAYMKEHAPLMEYEEK